MQTLKQTIEREMRRRGDVVVEAPSRPAVKRGREEVEAGPTLMQRASRGIVPALLAPVVVGAIQNAPFIFSISDSTEAFAAFASVALDAGSAAIFTTPVIFAAAAALPQAAQPSSQKRGRVDANQ